MKSSVPSWSQIAAFLFFFSFLVQISYSGGKCAPSESRWSGSQTAGDLVRSTIAHWVISIDDIIDYKENLSKAWFCRFFNRYRPTSLSTLVCFLQGNTLTHVGLFMHSSLLFLQHTIIPSPDVSLPINTSSLIMNGKV